MIRGMFDNYAMGSEIARGGMGTVNIAKNSRGNEVIVKTPLVTGDPNDTLRVDKLKVEATILKDIASNAQQNSIVKYLDESTENNIFHLITEKINGDTLEEAVGHTPLGEKTALSHISKILHALRFIHGHNIIHRDIKPKNIIMDPIRGPILIDFGAAKLGWTQMGVGSATMMYTPGWSCPHQTRGEITTSCDLYAAGAVLFFMVVGKYPQTEMDASGKLKRKPNQIRTGISQMVSDLIIKAIDPDHKQISTADDMLSYLQNKVVTPSTQPYIIIRGKRVLVKNEMDIGRAHTVCDKNCNAVGYQRPPYIAIEEKGQFKFISKHHLRIWKDLNGHFWIQDLRSRNGTAISNRGAYRIMSPGQKEMLTDNTNVAICYNSAKGPYLNFAFHER